MMDNIVRLIEQIGIRNLIFIGIGIVALVILLLFYRGMRLRKYRKLIVDVENRMNGIKSLPLQYRLGRVHSISKNMPEVLEKYEEYAQEFERITDYQKNQLGVLVNEVDEQLFYGKLRKISSKMKELESMLKIYEDDSQALLAKIEEITEIENVQRIEIIRVKEKYRQLIDYYETIRFKVEDFVKGIKNIFNNLDDSFVKLEDMMNNQRFEDAKNLTQDIDKKVDWLNARLQELPDYIAIVRQYIPKKIHYLDNLIKDMSNGEFALEKLNVSARYQAIQSTLETTTQHIQQLQLENVGEVLQKLVDDIDAIIKDLEVEKQSYDDFKTKWDESYTVITQIYDQYKQALIDQNRIENLYLINEDYVDIQEKYKDFDQILRESYDL